MALQKIRRTPGRRGAVNPPRSRAFFLELLINMLIFALCAVVALLVFVEGKVVTDESATLTRLSLDAETLAEEYKVYGVDPAELTLLNEDALEIESAVVAEDGTLTYHYNHYLGLSHPQEATHTLVITPVTSANELVGVVEIAGYTGEEQLFSFEVTHYQPQGGGSTDAGQ